MNSVGKTLCVSKVILAAAPIAGISRFHFGQGRLTPPVLKTETRALNSGGRGRGKAAEHPYIPGLHWCQRKAVQPPKPHPKNRYACRLRLPARRTSLAEETDQGLHQLSSKLLGGCLTNRANECGRPARAIARSRRSVHYAFLAGPKSRRRRALSGEAVRERATRALLSGIFPPVLAEQPEKPDVYS